MKLEFSDVLSLQIHIPFFPMKTALYVTFSNEFMTIEITGNTFYPFTYKWVHWGIMGQKGENNSLEENGSYGVKEVKICSVCFHYKKPSKSSNSERKKKILEYR